MTFIDIWFGFLDIALILSCRRSPRSSVYETSSTDNHYNPCSFCGMCQIVDRFGFAKTQHNSKFAGGFLNISLIPTY